MAGEATGDGGGAIYMYDGTLNMTGGAIIGGKATSGGNIHANRVNLNLTGGSIIDGSATNGGNIFVTGCSTAGCLNLGACTITGGSATYGGRDICLTNTGKMKVHKTFAGESYIGVEGDHLPSATPGSALSATWDSSEGAFPGQLYLENLPGNPSLCGIEGDSKLYIGAAALMQGSKKVWYISNAAAVAACGEADYLLPAAGELNLTGGSYTVDLAGKTLNITGTGSLVCFDSTNDAYQLSSGKVTIAQTVSLLKDVTAPNGNRYIALEENGSYSFHRLGLELKTVTLRTNKAGIYYKAEMVCDEALAAQIDRHGVAVSVLGVPDESFAADPNVGYTEILGAPKSIFTSGSIINIFRDGISLEKNARRGEMKIYANPYLKLKDGTVLMAQEGAAYSLLDVMEAINANWADYVAQGKAATIKEFYQIWAQYGMDAWADRLPNIAG